MKYFSILACLAGAFVLQTHGYSQTTTLTPVTASLDVVAGGGYDISAPPNNKSDSNQDTHATEEEDSDSDSVTGPNGSASASYWTDAYREHALGGATTVVRVDHESRADTLLSSTGNGEGIVNAGSRAVGTYTVDTAASGDVYVLESDFRIQWAPVVKNQDCDPDSVTDPDQRIAYSEVHDGDSIIKVEFGKSFALIDEFQDISYFVRAFIDSDGDQRYHVFVDTNGLYRFRLETAEITDAGRTHRNTAAVEIYGGGPLALVDMQVNGCGRAHYYNDATHLNSEDLGECESEGQVNMYATGVTDIAQPSSGDITEATMIQNSGSILEFVTGEAPPDVDNFDPWDASSYYVPDDPYGGYGGGY